MVDDTGFVKYDEELPSQISLKRRIAFGALMIATGVIGLAGWLIWSVDKVDDYGSPYYRPSYCERYDDNSNIASNLPEECQPAPAFSVEWFHDHWYFVAVPFALLLAGGLLLVTHYHGRLIKYYYDVLQGKIIQKDTREGGRYALQWVVLVEGYTRANELSEQWRGVNAGYWHDGAKVGDWIDQR